MRIEIWLLQPPNNSYNFDKILLFQVQKDSNSILKAVEKSFGIILWAHLRAHLDWGERGENRE